MNKDGGQKMRDDSFDNTRREKKNSSSFVFDNTREEKVKHTSSVFENARDVSRKKSNNYNENKRKENISGFSEKSSEEKQIDINTNSNTLPPPNGWNGYGGCLVFVVGILVLVIIIISVIISIVGSKRHQNHIVHMNELIDDEKAVDAVEFYNKKMMGDSKCRGECLSSLSSFATNTFSRYISEQIMYEDARNILQILVQVNDDVVSSEITDLLSGIDQIESAKEQNEHVEIDEVDDKAENEPAIIETKYLENCTILESNEYQGNEGDSFVYPIGQHKYTRGRCDISGKSYYHGIEAWIARWNYEDEISWAYSVFELPENTNSVYGEVVLIDSYNTVDFDSTLYFINAETDAEIESYHLTPDTIPFHFSAAVSEVQKLKILVTDNRAVSGGTSFGLVNAILDINEIDVDEFDAETDIPNDAFVWNGHSYYIYSNADSWEEAKSYCNSLGGHLAVITSKEENDAVYKYLENNNIENAYFGLTDRECEGVWKWIDGTNTVYTNWDKPTEPNAENPDEDYAMFYYKYPDGTWNDGDFGSFAVNDDQYYICEWE